MESASGNPPAAPAASGGFWARRSGWATLAPMATPRLRIGQLLVDARLISAAALDDVLAEQRADGRRLGTLLVERGLVNETQLTQILSHQLSVPWVSLLHIEFSRQLLNLVPREVADRFCLVPIYVRHVRNQGDTLYVAMDDPSNEDGLAACRGHAGLPVRSMIAPPTDIRSAIRVYYGVDTPREAARPASQPHPAVVEAPKPPPPRPVALPEASPPHPTMGIETPEAAALFTDAPITVEEPRGHAAAIAEPAVERTEATPEPVPPPPSPRSSADGPEIETREIDLDLARAERLRRALAPDAATAEPPETPPPPSSREVESIPRPRGRAPRMVTLTLLDGTVINLPAKRRPKGLPDPTRAASADGDAEGAVRTTSSAAPGNDDGVQGLTARDLVLALRVVANGADASEVLGSNLRWEALFSALLSLMLRKHLIADWEFIDELKKQV
jgi:type IV pilus assembly protein PilB